MMIDDDEIKIILLLSQYTNLAYTSDIESGKLSMKEVILQEIIEI